MKCTVTVVATATVNAVPWFLAIIKSSLAFYFMRYILFALATTYCCHPHIFICTYTHIHRCLLTLSHCLLFATMYACDIYYIYHDSFVRCLFFNTLVIWHLQLLWIFLLNLCSVIWKMRVIWGSHTKMKRKKIKWEFEV